MVALRCVRNFSHTGQIGHTGEPVDPMIAGTADDLECRQAPVASTRRRSTTHTSPVTSDFKMVDLQWATARITDLVKAVLRLHRPAQDEVGNG